MMLAMVAWLARLAMWVAQRWHLPPEVACYCWCRGVLVMILSMRVRLS